MLLAIVLFLVFQAVFAWAEWPMNAIEAATAWLGEVAGSVLPEGWVKSLIVNGLIAGVGGVVVFLPQIVILFAFILLLEEWGYLPRAAFLLDRLMGSVGLSGRSFIPLLSSFACAIPGIMAARTIANPRDRMVTIMIAPLMTCSARLPVYALLIGAFIPKRDVWGGFELQGVVLFVLYVAGIVGALAVAWVLERFTAHGQVRTLMMELPFLPSADAAQHRHRLVAARDDFRETRRHDHSHAHDPDVVPRELPSASRRCNRTGDRIQHRRHARTRSRRVVRTDRVQLADQHRARPGTRCPGSGGERARHRVCAVGHLRGHGRGADAAHRAELESRDRPFVLAWYVFAPQCLSTLATVKRETGGWAMPLAMAAYLFALAYAASFITYRIALLSVTDERIVVHVLKDLGE